MAVVKLFVGNLSWDTKDDQLAEFFSQAGQVVSASVVTDRYSGRSRGFGFVEMEKADAENAIKQLNGQELDGRAITVDKARPKGDKKESFKDDQSAAEAHSEQPRVAPETEEPQE